MARLTKEQYREQAAAKVAAAQELLAAEVAALVTGDDWRRFLDSQARLHDCDANIVMLIVAQHAQAYQEGRVAEPTPTYVAGFDTWAALDRHVALGGDPLDVGVDPWRDDGHLGVGARQPLDLAGRHRAAAYHEAWLAGDHQADGVDGRSVGGHLGQAPPTGAAAGSASCGGSTIPAATVALVASSTRTKLQGIRSLR